jgi:membrane-associated phospholipid phosphatase
MAVIGDSSHPGVLRLKGWLRPLSAADFIVVTFLLFLTLLQVIFRARIASWWIWVLLNGAIIGLVLLLARTAEQKPGKLIIGIHRWYLYPMVLYVFKELYFMIRPIHPVDYDELLIAIDRWMFGVDPTVWLSQFAHPVLTEILQIAYSSYYLLFIILGVEVYRRRTLQEFDRAGFMLVYGFFLSYLGYFLLPAVGPRFTLHDFHLLKEELPGLFLTEPLRWFVNTGESVPMHVPNPVDYVQRDVFPSGHTQLSLMVVYLAFHLRISTRWFLAVAVTLLVIGTVYLRYHYVIDVLAGMLFFGLTIWSGHHLERWWNRLRSRWGERTTENHRH